MVNWIQFIKRKKELLGVIRFRFLLLTLSCVFLGFAVGQHNLMRLNFLHFVMVVMGALAAHAAVNIFNEYTDYKSGLDLTTKRTPFSGGTGTIPMHPEFAQPAFVMGIMSMILVIVSTIYFIYYRGLGILWIAIAGILVILAYSKWIVRNPILCLISPGLGFGPLMVLGTQYALTGTYTLTALIVSLVPFFLVNNLLLLNQFPDIEPDRKNGRKNILIVLGTAKGCFIFTLFSAFTYLVIIIGVIFKILPLTVIFGLLTVPIAIYTIVGAFRYATNHNKLIPFMGMNVIINLTTPVLVGIGIIFSVHRS